MNLLRNFASDRSGSVMIVFALAIMTLFGFIGAAVDFARWHNAARHVTDLTDRALLAGGRHLQTYPDDTQGAIDTAKIYFDNQVKAGIVVADADAQFGMTADNMGLQARVTGSVQTPFLRLLDIKSLAISTESQVEFSAGGGTGTSVELAIMLDVTGSMCNNKIGPCKTGTKIDALKTAAKDLVSILVRDNQPAKVALVPFSTRVRVGDYNTTKASDLMKKLTDLPPTWSGWQSVCTDGSGDGGSETAGNWTCNTSQAQQVTNWPIFPCVSERTGINEFTDAPPGANDWLNAHDGTRFPLSQDSSTTPFTSGTGTSQSDPTGYWNYRDYDCYDIMASDTIMPLSKDANALKARIDGLEAYGSTSGALGTAWSWYLLSPRWSAIWTGDSAPAPYTDLTAKTSAGTPKLRKIAVLLTDGDYNTYRTWKGHDPVVVSNNAKQICENMKAKGIEVFTIGFELDQLPATQKAQAESTLQSCGTDIDHFYNSLDANQLQTAFRDIALKLSVLFLAK